MVSPGVTWVFWDVTELARGWVDMTTGNYGVVIRGYADQDNYAGFHLAGPAPGVEGAGPAGPL